MLQQPERYSETDHYIQADDDPRLVLKPTLAADKKLEKRNISGMSQVVEKLHLNKQINLVSFRNNMVLNRIRLNTGVTILGVASLAFRSGVAVMTVKC